MPALYLFIKVLRDSKATKFKRTDGRRRRTTDDDDGRTTDDDGDGRRTTRGGVGGSMGLGVNSNRIDLLTCFQNISTKRIFSFCKNQDLLPLMCSCSAVATTINPNRMNR
jgi:hypothetical protein